MIIRGDARNLPLAAASVDLVVTSPPFYALRSYTDGGEHYDGQIGSEKTPAEYVDNLIGCTREWMRVLKPSGSLWVNLGDAFSSGQRFDSGFTAQDAAWLAGVIDSDGSVSIRVDNGGRSHVAWTRVGQMRPEVVHRIGELTGVGKVWQDGRGVWNWNAAAQQARWVLERIWPWLQIKRRQALAAIDLMVGKANGKRKGRWNRVPDYELAQRETIRQAVLAWNRGEEFPDYEPPPATLVDLPRDPHFIPPKSLMGLPWRYALRCMDELDLILRAEVIWDKPNGLPESVTDRVRRSHEQWFHFTVSPRYYSAVDTIRQPYEGKPQRRGGTDHQVGEYAGTNKQTLRKQWDVPQSGTNPLGALPGSVWEIPTQPLKVPAHLDVDHFAAFPMEWPRRIIQGWSPSGVCTGCGEGRRPTTDRMLEVLRVGDAAGRAHLNGEGTHGADRRAGTHVRSRNVITGERCACPDTSAPSRRAVVLDPFGGTGTTSLVAHALGRTGISVDMSADYCRLAQWRTTDPGQIAAAMQVDKPPVEVTGQDDLLALL